MKSVALGSRDETPHGSGHPFGWGHGPYPTDYRLVFAFSGVPPGPLCLLAGALWARHLLRAQRAPGFPEGEQQVYHRLL